MLHLVIKTAVAAHFSSCAELNNNHVTTSGDYDVTIKGEVVTLYCDGMETNTPKAYVTLKKPNVARWLYGNISVNTTFHKVRINETEDPPRLIRGDCK